MEQGRYRQVPGTGAADQRLGEEVMRAQRAAGSLGCLLLDIDDFKQVNDSHGHRAGDQVLKELSLLIKQQPRGTDVLARFGGEEFSALLVDSDQAVTLEIAERIRRTIAELTISLDDGHELQITVSIGVSIYNGEDEGSDSLEIGELLIDRADQALYEAKNDGKNCLARYGDRDVSF